MTRYYGLHVGSMDNPELSLVWFSFGVGGCLAGGSVGLYDPAMPGMDGGTEEGGRTRGERGGTQIE